MVDEPANLPEPARCLLRALWTWCYDPPKRLDDATADVAAKRLIPEYLIRALADAMMPGGLDPDKVSGGWALLQDSKLVMLGCNDGRRDSERARYEMTGGRRYGPLGREPLQCVRIRAAAPWRPVSVPTGSWSWNGHTIDVRAVPNADAGSRIVVAVDDSKRFESAIHEGVAALFWLMGAVFVTGSIVAERIAMVGGWLGGVWVANAVMIERLAEERNGILRTSVRRIEDAE